MFWREVGEQPLQVDITIMVLTSLGKRKKFHSSLGVIHISKGQEPKPYKRPLKTRLMQNSFGNFDHSMSKRSSLGSRSKKRIENRSSDERERAKTEKARKRRRVDRSRKRTTGDPASDPAGRRPPSSGPPLATESSATQPAVQPVAGQPLFFT